MKLSWKSEGLCLALLLLMWVVSVTTWSAVPERLAVHWGAGGRPDRFGGKVEGLLLLPLLTAAVYGAMLVLPRFDPLRGNYAQFAGAYAGIRTLVVAFMFGIHLMVALWARGVFVPVNLVVPVLLGLLFVGLGAFLGQVRPTWFVGFRTPWTLSSEAAWEKTHRLGGRLFIAIGAVTMLLGLAHTAWAVPAILILVLAVILVLVIYSYRVWKNDPHRRDPAATPPHPG